jgi:hypothetical protein
MHVILYYCQLVQYVNIVLVTWNLRGKRSIEQKVSLSHLLTAWFLSRYVRCM